MSPTLLPQSFATDCRLEMTLEDVDFPIYVVTDNGMWLDTALLPVTSELYQNLRDRHYKIIEGIRLPFHHTLDSIYKLYPSSHQNYFTFKVMVEILPTTELQLYIFADNTVIKWAYSTVCQAISVTKQQGEAKVLDWECEQFLRSNGNAN